MTTSRLAILLAVLLAGLSSVFLLPKQLGFQPVGIELALPEILGEWWGREMAVTQQERDVLGPDTEFARKSYDNGRGDSILSSIVLAGHDMMTGIHRPERCLHAQGWNFEAQGTRAIPLPAGRSLQVTRLRNTKVVKGANDEAVRVDNICYYWFVGHDDTTPSHLERVWFDSRDRLFSGYVQRWAMIMIAADITKDRERFGRDEAQTDALLTAFVAKLAPEIHQDSVQPR